MCVCRGKREGEGENEKYFFLKKRSVKFFFFVVVGGGGIGSLFCICFLGSIVMSMLTFGVFLGRGMNMLWETEVLFLKIDFHFFFR